MADLVRVLVNGQETNVSRAWATKRKLQVLDDEATHRGDGTVRRPTREGGRPMKPRRSLPPAGGQDPVSPYADMTRPELEDLIDARNDARGDEEPQIVVEAPKNKPQLLAALHADDAAHTE